MGTIGVTKGHGTQGVIKRHNVNRLPRKTHRGLRKVGCIGAWHPAAVKWTVGRSGQMGYHSRTELNKDFLLIKGGVMGIRKRPIVIRKSIFPCTRKWMTEQVEVKFIDTSSKLGHGRFQTDEEKLKVQGPLAHKNRN